MLRFLSTLAAAFLVLTGFSVHAVAETYIVPVWADSLPASDGHWSTSTTVINPNAFPVTVQVTRVFPLQAAECRSCAVGPAPMTIGASSTAVISPPSAQPGHNLAAGAMQIETSAPVHIHLVAHRSSEHEIRQRLDVAREWLLPGIRSISTVERTVHDEWRINVFIVNPNETPLHVSIWAGRREENEVRATIAPGTTAVVRLPPPLCSGGPCPIGGVYPIPLQTVEIEADGVFLASVSSLGRNWAVFSLADEATVAR